MKKILCLLFAVLMTISFVACDSSTEKPSGNNSKPTGTNVDTSLKKGEITPVGDVFELPNVKQATGAPVLAEVTKQAYPGDSIMISGEGFKQSGVKFYVYAQTEKGNGKAHEAKFTVVDDNYASVLIDESLAYGAYGIYAESSAGTSAVKIVNKPVIWDIGLYKLTAGETLTILGENLTTENGDKTSVFLVAPNGKEYCEASVSFADPGKVEVIIPEGLTVGHKYKVKLHNGHGGEQGFAVAERTVEYLEATAVQFNGNIIDVTDKKYGADPESRSNDDSAAINKAFTDAKDGDTIYFPSGSYLIATKININKSVRILGAGADKTKIYAGYNITGGMFDIKKGPCEITGIRFEQKRTKGKLKGYFINSSTDSIEDGEYNLNIHSNVFIQSVTSKSRSSNWPINIVGSYGVIIKDNYFDATGMAYVANAKKVYFTNNEGIISAYCGVYYHITNALFTNTQFVDVSNNKVSGKGAPENGSGNLENDTFTAGRVFTVQGWGHDIYISHNTVRRAGIPNLNSGEIIMFENVAFTFDGDVETSTADTTTLRTSDKNKANAGNVISIVSGKGRGQYRKIAKRAKNVLTLEEPWDIIPDSTSHVIVNSAYLNSFVCYNDIDGHDNWAEIPGATTGLQAYGAIHNMTYSFNNIKNTSTGIDFTPFYYTVVTSGQEADARCVLAWNSFDRNTFQNMGRAISIQVQTWGDDPSKPYVGEIAFGNTFRANNIKDISAWTGGDRAGTGGLGIRMGIDKAGNSRENWPGNWCIANLYESNNFSNCTDTDVRFFNNQKNNVFRNNKNGDGKARLEVAVAGLGPIETTY